MFLFTIIKSIKVHTSCPEFHKIIPFTSTLKEYSLQHISSISNAIQCQSSLKTILPDVEIVEMNKEEKPQAIPLL